MFNIDWNYWSKLKPLLAAGSYTKRVGQIIAQFIKLLEQNFGVSRVDMHVIGFSLGGQVSSQLTPMYGGLSKNGHGTFKSKIFPYM